MQNIGKVVQIVRNAKGISISKLAQDSSVSVSFLSLVEKGERQPSIEVIGRISTALQIPSEALILLAMPKSQKITSADEGVSSITDSIEKLIEAEKSLKRLLIKIEENHAPG